MRSQYSGPLFLLLAFARIAFSAPATTDFTPNSDGFGLLNETEITATGPSNTQSAPAGGENTDRFGVQGTNPEIFMVLSTGDRGLQIDERVMRDTLSNALKLAQQLSAAYPADDQILKENFVYRASEDAKAHFTMEPDTSRHMTWADVIGVCGDEGLIRYLDLTRRWFVAEFGLEEAGPRKHLGHGALRPGPGDQPSTPIPSNLEIVQPAFGISR